MNKRIRELAKQADDGYTGDNRDDMGHALVGEDAIEKFAELIVRECVDICMEMSAKCAGLPGDGAVARDCANWIKKDFGVEE